MSSLPAFFSRNGFQSFWAPSKSLFASSTAGAATPVSAHSFGSRTSTSTALPAAISLAACSGETFWTSSASASVVVTRRAAKKARSFMAQLIIAFPARAMADLRSGEDDLPAGGEFVEFAHREHALHRGD